MAKRKTYKPKGMQQEGKAIKKAMKKRADEKKANGSPTKGKVYSIAQKKLVPKKKAKK